MKRVSDVVGKTSMMCELREAAATSLPDSLILFNRIYISKPRSYVSTIQLQVVVSLILR